MQNIVAFYPFQGMPIPMPMHCIPTAPAQPQPAQKKSKRGGRASCVKGVPWGRRAGHRDGEFRLFVSGLPQQTAQAELAELFRPFGRMLEVFVMPRVHPQTGTRSAFVRFTTVVAGTNAIQSLNGMEWRGHVLAVCESKYNSNQTHSGQQHANVNHGVQPHVNRYESTSSSTTQSITSMELAMYGSIEDSMMGGGVSTDASSDTTAPAPLSDEGSCSSSPASPVPEMTPESPTSWGTLNAWEPEGATPPSTPSRKLAGRQSDAETSSAKMRQYFCHNPYSLEALIVPVWQELPEDCDLEVETTNVAIAVEAQ